jgi:hypothetical protein
MGTPQPPTECKSITETINFRTNGEIIPEVLSDLVRSCGATTQGAFRCGMRHDQSAVMSYRNIPNIDRKQCPEVGGAKEAASVQDWQISQEKEMRANQGRKVMLNQGTDEVPTRL